LSVATSGPRRSWDTQPTFGVGHLLLLLTLLAALFLRVYRLAEVPAGVDYDEAGNFILAQEIAAGQSHPVFIRAYAGREAIFYWLAAASMRLLGRTLFAFRLAAALCGVGTVLLGYLLAREMFRDEPPLLRRWVPSIGAALMAVSYWPVHVSRYGFRVNAMTLFLAAMMVLLWRGLRRGRWLELAAAGILCGLAANTYLAVRAFPLVLLFFAAWVILAWRPGKEPGSGPSPARGSAHAGWRWQRAGQWALFGGAALLAFAPLGLFFLRNPEYFSTRMGQVSIFDPAIHGGDLWGTLGRVTLDALGVFTVRGDSNPVYNFDQRPIFGPVSGFFFYLGLLACLWAVFAPRSRTGRDLRARTPYALILVWLPVMLLPNVLGARGVPHSLRSMGLLPVVYDLPALGLLAAVQAGQRVLSRDGDRTWGARWARLRSRLQEVGGQRGWAGGLLVLGLLAAGGARTYHWYFDLWTRDAEAYYRSAADVRLAAEYLGRWNADEVTLFASNDTYRHTTIAAFCANYERLNWISGSTLVLPGDRGRPALYVFDHTNPLDPLLARYIPAGTLQHRELGPDGKVGFEAYLVPPDQIPLPQPQVPLQANLGGVLSLIGYDLNAPILSGGVLDVTLYWRVLREVDRDDYAFFAHLVDDLGFRWGGETFFHYPSRQWRPGDVLLFRQRIAVAPGAPPGAYTIDAGVFSPSLDARLPLLDEAGQMSGTVARVGPLDVARAAAPPAALPPIQQPLQAAFLDAPAADGSPSPALSLLGLDRDRSDLRPGETLALSLYWQAAAPLGAATVSLWLEGEGEALPLWEGDPVHGRYPFVQWQPPEFVRDRYALRLPAGAPAGDWELRLALLRPDGTPLPTADGGTWVPLGTIHVRASDRLWEPPAIAHPVEARLGDVVELLGYDLDRPEARPGEVLHLTLVWRCLDEMDVGYTVFTHLLDAGEQVRGQQDNPPRGGTYPTTLWAPGEVVVDEFEIAVHADAPPGSYVVEVGMYDPANLQRLPVLDPTGAAGDRILLGSVQVTAAHP
jgi:hypothetical protein